MKERKQTKDRTLPNDKRELARLANTGDQDAFAKYLELGPLKPVRPSIIADNALLLYLHAVDQNQLADAHALSEDLKSMRQDMEGPHPSPLERLLVERIVLCYVALYRHEMLLAGYGGKVEAERRDRWERISDRMHRRYLTAIKTLAQVRRLQIPSVQVNIADKQINLG